MRKTIESILVILFQIALVTSFLTEYSLLRTITTVVFFPAMLFICMLTKDSNGESDLCVTCEMVVVLLQSLVWDNAINLHGGWSMIFLISLIPLTGWLIYRIQIS